MEIIFRQDQTCPRRDKIANVKDIEITADKLIDGLLNLSKEHRVCLLDSSGVGHLGSHLLIAGIDPLETGKISDNEPTSSLELLGSILSIQDRAVFFTISYEFGAKLNGILSRHNHETEPDVFYASFDAILVHDYTTGTTTISGNADKFDNIISLISNPQPSNINPAAASHINSNFTKGEYIAAVEKIQNEIRSGNTYQTNLTMKLTADLGDKTACRDLQRSSVGTSCSVRGVF